jgi:hypothetical protein
MKNYSVVYFNLYVFRPDEETKGSELHGSMHYDNHIEKFELYSVKATSAEASRHFPGRPAAGLCHSVHKNECKDPL